ncbi:glycosyltransferase family 4 protein [Candidatus Saccharibacteria bacterium]|nr:glycosyltransferase family 4 protein [Candidatus Saccharibacteria bacterium]
MKLFFDARYIRTDFHDGISRYSYELGHAIAKQQEVTFIVSSDEQAAMLPHGSEAVKIHGIDSWREPFTSTRLNKYGPDVVFSPMQTLGTFGRRFKLILTLHDMIYYIHRLPPPGAKGIVRPIWRLFHLTYWPQRLVLNRADTVATVSQTSRAEIAHARLTKRPLIVISNAARDLTPLLKTPVLQHTEAPKNLVFMGTLLPYKNAETLIEMMRHLPNRTLHLCSKISPARKAQLASRVPKGAHVVFHNGVSDEVYTALLADDAIMVSASRAEGFGLPLAEALKLGVPAVVSDRPFFREIAGDESAVFADPNDAENFARSVQSLNDLSERKRRIKAGVEAVDRFSWDQSAKILIEACKNLSK